MYGHACREQDSWMSDEMHHDDWAPAAQTRRIAAPARGYSRRSALLANLRSESEWVARHADDYIRAPSESARHSAEAFINNLSEACLEGRLAISQDGEINFFFGDDSRELFQVLIDASGLVSYYANLAGEDIGGSDTYPEQFPYLKLLAFVDRNK